MWHNSHNGEELKYGAVDDAMDLIGGWDEDDEEHYIFCIENKWPRKDAAYHSAYVLDKPQVLTIGPHETDTTPKGRTV